MPERDPSRMAITVEGARLALRQAGPTSGLHGQAAVAMDRMLTDIRVYLEEISERRRARLEREAAE